MPVDEIKVSMIKKDFLEYNISVDFNYWQSRSAVLGAVHKSATKWGYIISVC